MDEILAFSVKIDGVDRAINSVSDLRKAKKDATEAFIKGDKEAAKALADLKDKTEDLADATQTLKGSGVEKINASFNQLGDGLKNFDTDKIRLGFKGIGAAMSAIPIFLLIEGLRYLAENFDKVSGAVKSFFNITSSAEKQVKKLQEAVLELQEANSILISTLENEIKILEAQGKSQDKILELRKRVIAEKIKEAELDTQLQKAKIQEILLNDNLTESLYRGLAATARLQGKNQEAALFDIKVQQEKDARLKEASDLLRTDLIAINSLKTESQVQDIKRENELTAEQKKQNEIRLQNHKDYNAKKLAEDKILQAESDAFWNKELANIAADQAAKDAARFAEEQAQLDLEARQVEQDKLMYEGIALRNQESLDQLAAQKEAAKQKEAENDKMWAENSLQAAGQLTSSLSSLSDSYFSFKRKNLEKGSAEDLKQAKKQFDINKGLAIASATISGIQGVVNALSAQSIIPEPYGTVLKVVTAVAVGAAAAANIAKIASSKFDAGGSGGGGGSAAAVSIPIPAPPTINTPNANTNQTTSFDESGKKIGGEEKLNQTITVKATVGVDEVSTKQERVETLEKQATF